jgi:hypothetical protein
MQESHEFGPFADGSKLEFVDDERRLSHLGGHLAASVRAEKANNVERNVLFFRKDAFVRRSRGRDFLEANWAEVAVSVSLTNKGGCASDFLRQRNWRYSGRRFCWPGRCQAVNVV